MLVETFFLLTVTRTVRSFSFAAHRSLFGPPCLFFFFLLVFRFSLLPTPHHAPPLLPSKTPTSSRASRVTRGWKKEKSRGMFSIQKLRYRALISQSIGDYRLTCSQPLVPLNGDPSHFPRSTCRFCSSSSSSSRLPAILANRIPIIEPLQARRPCNEAHAEASLDATFESRTSFIVVPFPSLTFAPSRLSLHCRTSKLREPRSNFRVHDMQTYTHRYL